MDWAIVTEAPLAVRVHIGAALAAITLGPVAIFRHSRDWLHHGAGALWVFVMGVLAISGLLIPASLFPLIGPFGPIHLLSLWALWSLSVGLAALWRGQRAKHGAEMRALYWQGLALAGLLTLLPGRRLNRLLFGEVPMMGLWIICLVALALAILLVRRRVLAK
ncbi:DUF2306 domain-containing protein [Gymnodinialimonas hymeniacidonis]|uniref:DUF2306 domain-containing protein n=1 Tax=Gymnodinialimonas hymeniacidonis TaxID=3126508 RepID=UPI0034C66705